MSPTLDGICTVSQNVPSGLTVSIASFNGPTWGPSGADRTQVDPMLAPWTLLSWYLLETSTSLHLVCVKHITSNVMSAVCWYNIDQSINVALYPDANYISWLVYRYKMSTYHDILITISLSIYLMSPGRTQGNRCLRVSLRLISCWGHGS